MSEDNHANVMYQLEQEHMLAQIVSAMPNNIEGAPDITTPAPIRSIWAHRLYQQGVRVHPEQATHRVVPMGAGVGSAHGPREFQKISNDKMMKLIQDANPALYKRIMAARDDHHGGPAVMDAMLQQIMATLPPEFIEKMSEATHKANDFAGENIPEEEPPSDSA